MSNEHARQAGEVDPVFNNGSVDLSHTGPESSLMGITNTSDGGVLALSLEFNTEGYFVTKLTRSGQLDGTFGTGGFIHVVPPINLEAWSIHALEDDSCLVMGTWTHTLLVSRFKSNGSLDTAYGIDGHAVVEVPDLIRIAGREAPSLAMPLPQQEPPGETAQRLPSRGLSIVLSLLDGDRLYLIFTIGWELYHEQMTVALRLDAQGGVDTTFNGSGYVVVTLAGTGIEYNTSRLAFLQQQDLQPRQLVVAVQESIRDEGNSGDVYMVRLNESGQQDFSFGAPHEHGVVHITRAQLWSFYTAFTDQNGAIKLLGFAAIGDGAEPAIRGYTASGKVDTAFNAGETLLIPVSGGIPLWENGASLGVGADARMLLLTNQSDSKKIVVRLLADGAFDTAFGAGGIVRLTSRFDKPVQVTGSSFILLPNGDSFVGAGIRLYRLLGNPS
ncbi:hypothetical protein RAM80_30055 [Pseudomonas sp. App30]|uniref:hypothetical protein n=1 Tax=Pseudomonas sp. App30 TaxID=3068990 RepID=UPI003A806BD9